jgi:hypothetical protein
MAPELLDPDNNDATVNKETDVYSFSMVAIEVFTGMEVTLCMLVAIIDPQYLGEYPFKEIRHDASVTYTVVYQDRRPARPEQSADLGLTDDVWDVIQQCWRKDPTSRPKMTAIAQRLENPFSTFNHILYDLCHHNTNSNEFAADLKSMLCSEYFKKISSSLPEPELTELVELLDKVTFSRFHWTECPRAHGAFRLCIHVASRRMEI